MSEVFKLEENYYRIQPCTTLGVKESSELGMNYRELDMR